MDSLPAISIQTQKQILAEERVIPRHPNNRAYFLSYFDKFWHNLVKNAPHLSKVRYETGSYAFQTQKTMIDHWILEIFSDIAREFHFDKPLSIQKQKIWEEETVSNVSSSQITL